MNIEINPEFKALLPPLPPEEYAQLEKNILANGCREPLVVFNGVLVDGHNRHEICIQHGLPYKTVAIDFADSLGAKLWMIRNQFGRRNLSNFQRASLALEMKPMLAEQAKLNQGTRTDICQKSDKGLTPIDVKKELAKEAGVSHDTIAKVEKILAVANEDIKAQVLAGEVSINEAYNAINSGTRHVLVTVNTGDEEWYTPEKYLKSARLVMGSIDLDPASNPMAQQNVKAGIYYTQADDGLSKHWQGKVWLNPPFTARVINVFLEKLVSHFEINEITEAIVLTNNSTDTSWFHKSAQHASAICFTAGRINFLKSDGSTPNPPTTSSPTNGQLFFYFGSNPETFKNEFSQYGLVMVKL